MATVHLSWDLFGDPFEGPSLPRDFNRGSGAEGKKGADICPLSVHGSNFDNDSFESPEI